MAEINLNARISEAANEKLTSALERHPRVSKQQLVEDLIVLYLDYWEELQTELLGLKQNWVKQQMKLSTTEKRQAG
jgi:hypothetical protein